MCCPKINYDSVDSGSEETEETAAESGIEDVASPPSSSSRGSGGASSRHLSACMPIEFDDGDQRRDEERRRIIHYSRVKSCHTNESCIHSVKIDRFTLSAA